MYRPVFGCLGHIFLEIFKIIREFNVSSNYIKEKLTTIIVNCYFSTTRTIEALQLGCPILHFHPASLLDMKQTNIVFLKTHKTASSTVQNLLFCFAERNNLRVALPVQSCGHQFCYPRTFKADFVHPHMLPPNVITNHMRFNKTALQHLMPNKAIYVTILREPASMFESLFTETTVTASEGSPMDQWRLS